jgi:cysteinyl-tRNA synthetase
LRYFVLSTHYRRPIEYSPEEIEAKRKGLQSFYRLFDRIERVTGSSVYDGDPAVTKDAAASACGEASAQFVREIQEFRERFTGAMDDDFNTAAAIAVLFEQATAVNRFIETQKLEHSAGEAARPAAVWAGRELVETARLLGLFLAPPAEASRAGDETVGKVLPLLVEARTACKKSKDFATADLIRDRLGSVGVTLEDRPGETAWRIEGEPDGLLDQVMDLLIEVRAGCKKSKNFAIADLIRDGLTEAGITLEDRPDGTTWRASEKQPG